MKVQTKFVNDKIKNDYGCPEYGSANAAGFDLRSAEDTFVLKAGESRIIGTGVAIFVEDPCFFGLMAPRSGLGIKHGIILRNSVGIIDSDYQNEIRLGLYNSSNEDFEVQFGDRVCQFLVIPVQRVEFSIVDEFDKTTERGLGGLGSTGKN